MRGEASAARRPTHAVRLLEWGTRRFASVRLAGSRVDEYFNASIDGEAAYRCFGGKLGFNLGLEVKVDHAVVRIASGFPNQTDEAVTLANQGDSFVAIPMYTRKTFAGPIFRWRTP